MLHSRSSFKPMLLWRYRPPELIPPEHRAAPGAGSFSVYKDKAGDWYAQNEYPTAMTARFLFSGTNNVFALGDCLLPGYRVFLWWMAANPTLSLSLVNAQPC